LTGQPGGRTVRRIDVQPGKHPDRSEAPMHKLLVLYNEPKDPAHFRKYYVETHVPLANKMPGLKSSRYTFDVKPLGPGKAPYFCIFEGEFESEAALMRTLESKEGQSVAADIPNYATGGVTIVHFATK
jgi:uncharacterized protein (TIGR02118 family)